MRDQLETWVLRLRVRVEDWLSRLVVEGFRAEAAPRPEAAARWVGPEAAAAAPPAAASLRLPGTARDDRLIGGAASDLLIGDAGDDRLSGGGARDLLIGGIGNDDIAGDDGADLIFAGAGHDQAWGGTGGDLLHMAEGNDAAYGGEGNDLIALGAGNDAGTGGSGNDRILGEAGADRLTGNEGSDVLSGGDGRDLLSGDAEADILYGGADGDALSGGTSGDLLYGGTGADVLRGGDGRDVLSGQEDDDILFGDAGNDVLVGGGGNDRINGGIDLDTIVLRGNHDDYAITRDGDTLTFTDLVAGRDGTDIVTSIEYVRFADGTVPAAALAQPTVLLWSDLVAEHGAEHLAEMEIFIPDDVILMIDSDVAVRSLFIEGEVIVMDAADLAITVEWILAHDGGSFVAGTEADPFAHRLTVTLTGEAGAQGSGGLQDHATRMTLGEGGGHHHAAAPRPQESNPHGHANMGNRFFSAMGEGSEIELISASAAKTSWTKLGDTAAAGATAITLAAPVDWQVGDRIVIATTDFDTDHNEAFTITAISADGRTLSLDQPLGWSHFGELQRYATPSKTMFLDERAEVGLLSRNITVQGAGDATASGYGAHMMVMAGSSAEIEGVEFTRVGQLGQLGKYPFHWHLAGDVDGQCFMNNSIHESYNRAVTIHGSNNANVLDNVAYDITGHAYFLEDGQETGNRLEGNLAVAVKSTDRGVLSTDAEAAGFWISNWNNRVVGNTVAGAVNGFWFQVEDTTEGTPSAAAFGAINPQLAIQGLIRGNTAHSLEMDGYFTPVNTAHPRTVRFEDFLIYKADQVAWNNLQMVSVEHVNTIAADVLNFGVIQGDVVTGGLRVGISGNIGTIETEAEAAAGRDLHGGHQSAYMGFAGYDVPITFRGILIAGFDTDNPAFQTAGAMFKSSVDFLGSLIFADDLDLSARIGLKIDDFDRANCQFVDIDGSIRGDGRFAAYVPDPMQNRTIRDGTTGFVRLAGSVWHPDAGLVRNPDTLGGLLIGFWEMLDEGNQELQITRSDGEFLDMEGTWQVEATPFSTLVARDGSFSYTAEFSEYTPSAFRVKFQYVEVGDALRLTFANLHDFAGVSEGVRVASLAALDAARGMAHYWDGQNLHLRIVTNDSPFTDIGLDTSTGLMWEGDITVFAVSPGTTGNVANRIVGTAVADVRYGFDGDDVVFGLAGDDTLILGAGADRAEGGDGADTLLGGHGDDSLSGQEGDDRLRGGMGADSLLGDQGDDALFGEWDEDFVFGGAGDDTLSGGAGKDRLWGGSGADVFALTFRGAADTVQDFEDGVDRLDLSDLGIGFEDVDIRRSWGVTAVSYTDDFGMVRLLLPGVALSALDETDFLF